MTTFADRVYEMGGVPVGGAGNAQAHPVFGNEYFVHGLLGSNSNDGNTPTVAVETVQEAVTRQIAETTGLGDVIYIFPGTYAESVTGNLTRVQLIGLTCGGATHAVSIRPTASYAYTGEMMEAALRNLMLMSPSSSNKTLPAVLLEYGGYSVLDNNIFIGRDTTCITGLQLGPETDNDTVAKFDYSYITHNKFSTFYGANHQFEYAIKHSHQSTVNNPTKKQMWESVIAYNTIMAKTTGIHLGCGAGKIDGTLIEHNTIHSMESDNGCATAGIAAGVNQQSVIVRRNNIVAADGIVNFGANTTQDNYVAVSGTVSTELPALT